VHIILRNRIDQPVPLRKVPGHIAVPRVIDSDHLVEKYELKNDISNTQKNRGNFIGQLHISPFKSALKVSCYRILLH
jgi:hypothetical protein